MPFCADSTATWRPKRKKAQLETTIQGLSELPGPAGDQVADGVFRSGRQGSVPVACTKPFTSFVLHFGAA
jgi:hypothetical protein